MNENQLAYLVSRLNEDHISLGFMSTFHATDGITYDIIHVVFDNEFYVSLVGFFYSGEGDFPAFFDTIHLVVAVGTRFVFDFEIQDLNEDSGLSCEEKSNLFNTARLILSLLSSRHNLPMLVFSDEQAYLCK